ncbi:MAG: RNA 2',3'-cyclic phosphodiesterase [Synergistales bacterium]|nr:RNA 2',3'-cyclic phosphodiesterase [Synergistales bacterium]
MSHGIRAFVCIPLSHHLTVEITQWVSRLKAFGPRLKWVRPEAMHITLKFLGDITPQTAKCLDRQLQGSLQSRHTAMPLSISGAGAFPSLRSPRVLWLGINENDSELQRIYETVESSAVACGLERERRGFHPHVTLARLKQPGDCTMSLLEALTEEPLQGKSWMANKVILMRSDLQKEGARYTPMGEYRLPVGEDE